MPVDPATPDSDVLIVPRLSMGASGSGEATPGYTPAPGTTGTRGITRATTYPYVMANAAGKKNIIVTKDANGETAGATFHAPWQQTPAHTDTSKDATGAFINSRSPRFEVAEENALDSSPWGETNTGCTAPWRRPTWDELMVIYNINSELANPLDKVVHYWYAAATEKGGEGCHVNFSIGRPGSAAKGNMITVRCVRDVYPYVTTNADGKMSVIVSRDEYGTSGAAMHTPWTQSPYHVHTDPLNSVSYRFEVAQEDDYTVSEAWTSENGRCAAPWRRPTEKELKLVWNMGAFLDITPLAYVKAGTYWSSTTEATNTKYCLGVNEDGTTGTWLKNSPGTGKASTRCVRDLFDNFPDAPGSSVATLWGYTNTTGLVADNLVPHTVIKSTTTGFALENQRYYPADGNKKLYFYAHAPNTGATITEGNNPTVTYILDGQKDVMWAKDDRGIAKSSIPTLQEQPFLRFQHKLMQLKFQLKADASFPTGTEKVTKITVKRVSTQAALTVVTGGVVFGGQGDISIAPTTSNTVTIAGITLAEMLLTEPKNTVTLVVEVGGVTYPEITVNLAGTGAGTAGMSHLITLTLKRNAIVPTASTVDWTTGAGSDIGVI